MKKIILLLLLINSGLFAATEVTRITFKHSSDYDKDDLLDIIRSEEDEEFEPRLLKLDKILLSNFFRKNGYLLVEVSDSLFFNKNRTQLRIKYIINNGPQYYYGGVVFNGIVEGDTSKIQEAFEEIETGLPFDESLIVNASSEVENVYYNSGKPFVNVKTDYQFEHDSLVIARIDIEENETIYIDKIQYLGLKIVQEFLIRRELEINKGDVYNRELMEKTQQNIYSTGLFQFVRMEIDPIKDAPDKVILKIIMQEKDARWVGFYIGAGHEQTAGNTAEFTIQGGHRNIYGTARSASLHLTPSFTYDFKDKRVINSKNNITFKFVEPWIGNTRTPGIFHVDYQQIRYLNTAHFDLIQTSFEIHHKFDYNIEINGTIGAKFLNQLDDKTIDPLEFPELAGGRSRIYSISAYGKRDTRPNLFNPDNGSLMDLSLSFSRSLGGENNLQDNQFFTVINSWSRYMPVKIKIFKRKIPFTLAGRVKVGSIFELGDNKNIPVSELFYAGGATTVRGYPERLLGPVIYDEEKKEITDALGGKLLTLINVEARIPLFWLFEAEVFIDGGNVWSELSYFDYQEMRYATGCGIAVLTPLGPIRVDYGYKLNKRKVDRDPDAFHLGIYFAF